MYNLLKWLSVLLFISLPALLIAAIWNGDFRFLWISFVSLMFSLLCFALADVVKARSGD